MAEKQLKFQEAMKRLDAIVNQLNDQDLELETAMDLFEEGLMLSKQCSRQLEAFETKVNQLMEVQEETHEDPEK
ncbi:exodeoxyribonuclease VII small subunit [Faecalicoccus acidiformans]|uniref:Exodeoxyribonuclease 7 small subunit n=1 Tax=Faecalicoccus acidiformans TaxID=915173 RepID=A0A7W8D216_9FIRM|nr:exodeoxyribonuclease VII small subunit [Faecalicoccus acidiformans]MBB5185324.1 exodeoxyribonuclease VII small subunit [Faecalicoccus acidiformans]MBM6830904.1 exodeoxyribonuclease VII small subunit [Faecalicoccus acidiformans]MDM8203904.1 exodeoxyribonuclease VII small subunit [Faecalicoccus acidiformans]